MNLDDFPEIGMKLVCVAGYINGNTIWKQVGTVKKSAKGNFTIFLDKVFNPAGIMTDDNGPSVALHAKEYSQEELDRIMKYKEPSRSQGRKAPSERKSKPKQEDLEDDIPF